VSACFRERLPSGTRASAYAYIAIDIATDLR
jgi:hypothetical protein